LLGDETLRAKPPRRAIETAATATLAVAMGLGLAVLVDLGGPRADGGRLATTAASSLPGDDLASKMEAQIAAGAPGVAMALESAAPFAARGTAAVSIAHARAQFELGDARAALESVRTAARICAVLERCTPGERAQLARAETVFAAVVAAGVSDPRRDPERVDHALSPLFQGASFAR
jgi:hypothetical protein